MTGLGYRPGTDSDAPSRRKRLEYELMIVALNGAFTAEVLIGHDCFDDEDREQNGERRGVFLRRIGAAKRTRTSTPVKELAPQASASTSSAMAALIRTASGGAKRRRSSNKSSSR